MASWVAEHEPPTLTLDPTPDADGAAAFAGPARRLSRPSGSPPTTASRTARSAASKPIFEWVLSQKGLVVEAPQRHSTIAVALGQLELVAVRVDDRHRARDLVGAVVADLDDHWLVSMHLFSLGVQRVAHIHHPEVHEIVPSHHCVVRFRQRRPVRERGAEAVAEALVVALEDADVSRWPPGWAVSDRHTDLWAVNGRSRSRWSARTGTAATSRRPACSALVVGRFPRARRLGAREDEHAAHHERDQEQHAEPGS